MGFQSNEIAVVFYSDTLSCPFSEVITMVPQEMAVDKNGSDYSQETKDAGIGE